ncbi:MAG TPA: flagellar biosynthesis protein FlhB [Caulobacteraceae bacterium]|nr:flagellar biosynthesis protein FlhB [Caulobacteraceae bacterium]
MAEDSDQQSKTEEPTQRRLDEARRQGDVAKSPDLPPWAAMSAAVAVLAISGGAMARNMVTALLPFVAHPDSFQLDHGGAVGVAKMAAGAAWPFLITVMVAAGVAGAAGNIIQTGFIWAPGKLAPSTDKVNPLGGFKRLFGLDGWIQFAKSLAKVLLIAVVCYLALKPRLDQMANLSLLDPMAMGPFMVDALKALFFSVLGVLGVGAIADWVLQRQRFMARMRMSREDIKEELRQSEGDPHVKARLRQIRLQRAKRRMMQKVPKATVIIANPTHFAVALRYDTSEAPAPVCVAKGVDSLALKIREVAEKHNVPVIEDPPLARALYATVEMDQVIPPEHYQAVAKIIGFILGVGRRGARRARV